MKHLISLGVAFQSLVSRVVRRLDAALIPAERFTALPAAAGAATAQRGDPVLRAVAAAPVGADSIASLPRRARRLRASAAVPPTIDELLRVATAPEPPRPPRRAQLGRRWAHVAYFGASCGGRAPSPARYL